MVGIAFFFFGSPLGRSGLVKVQDEDTTCTGLSQLLKKILSSGAQKIIFYFTK